MDRRRLLRRSLILLILAAALLYGFVWVDNYLSVEGAREAPPGADAEP